MSNNYDDPRRLPDNGNYPGYNNIAQGQETNSNPPSSYPPYPTPTPSPYSAPPSLYPPNLNNSGNPYGYGAADGGARPTPPIEAVKNPTRKSRAGLWIGLVVVAALLAGLLGFFLASNRGGTNNTTVATAPATTVASGAANNANTPATTNVVQQPATNNTQGLLTVQQVAERVRPTVVQITSQQNANINSTNPFFGNGNGSSNNVPQETGVGSGVIYDKAGYILTNFHVIDGANSLLVTLPDGRSFDGKIIGKDQLTDLAVIQIDPKGENLPVAQLGDSSTLRVGDGTVAIGNALALPGGPTVTSGVVSALDRSVTEPGTQSQGSPLGGSAAATSGPQLYGLVQTDAAINPGNSGGALVDMQGRIIGINTLVAGQAEPGVQAQGIGFAISINQAKEIAQQLVANGKVSHAFVGVSYQPLTPVLANRLKLDSSVKAGAVLMQVQQGSPASKAGLKQGDVVTAIDGQKLTTESALGQIINKHKPGDKLTLEVITSQANGGNGQPRSVDITLGERTSS